MSNDTRKCEHIKTNGVRCGSPALRDESFCYFHHRARRDFPHRAELVADPKTTGGAAPFPAGEGAQGAPRTTLDIPFPEDADAIQYGLGKVIYGLLNGLIDHRTAGLALYALQTASANLKNTSMFKRAQEDDEREANPPSPLMTYYLEGIRNTPRLRETAPEHAPSDAPVHDSPAVSPENSAQSLNIHAEEDRACVSRPRAVSRRRPPRMRTTPRKRNPDRCVAPAPSLRNPVKPKPALKEPPAGTASPSPEPKFHSPVPAILGWRGFESFSRA